MTVWIERIEGHPIHELIERLDGLAGELEGANEEATTAIERIRRVVAYVGQRLAVIDPQLLTPAQLDQVAGPLGTVTASVEAYKSAPDQAHLTQANNYLDSALSLMSSWPLILDRKAVESLRESAWNYRRSVAQLLRRIRSEAEAVSDRLAAAQAGMEDQIVEARGQVEAQLEALRGQVSEVSATVRSQKERLDTAIAEFQQQFSSAQETRSQAFDNFTREQTEKATEFFQQLANEGRESSDDLESQAEQTLAELTRYRDEAAKLSQLCWPSWYYRGLSNVR